MTVLTMPNGTTLAYHIQECVEGMTERIKDETVDLVITSPPYDLLRSYNGNIERFNFEDIASQLKRVIKPGGVIVWVVGDQSNDWSESGTSFRHALFFKDNLGLNLFDTMIFMKASTRYPPRKGYWQQFEYMFVFSKGEPAIFNPSVVRVNKTSQKGRMMSNRQADGEIKKRKVKGTSVISSGGNVWSYAVGPAGEKRYKTSSVASATFDHPASFPLQLAKDHILSWTNKGCTVLDPMCFPRGTIIKTYDSWEDISNIQPMCKVMTRDGYLQTVSHKYEREYTGTMVKIESEGCNIPIRCTPNHPILVVRNMRCIHSEDRPCMPNRCHYHAQKRYIGCKNNDNREMDWVEAKDVSAGDMMYLPIPRNTDDTKSIPLYEGQLHFNARKIPRSIKLDRHSMELFGLFVSEGFTDKNAVYISNVKYAGRCKQLLERVFKTHAKSTKVTNHTSYSKTIGKTISGKSARTMICSKTISSFFSANFGVRSHNKKIPPFIMNAPPEMQVHFLRGLMMGDGMLVRHKKRKDEHAFQFQFGYATVSKTLAFQYRDLLLRQGICPSIRYSNQKGTIIGVYRVNIYNADDVDRLFYLIRSRNYLSYNKPTIKKMISRGMIHKVRYKDGFLITIKSVELEHVENETVYNLGVSNDHTYVTSGGVVHNCGSGTTLLACLQTARNGIGFEIDPTHKKTIETRLQVGNTRIPDVGSKDIPRIISSDSYTLLEDFGGA